MKVIFTVAVLLFCLQLQAQDGRFEKLYITPGITAGYTFGATFNIGLNLDLTTSMTNDFDKIRRSGISIGHYIVLNRGKNRPHQITHLDLKFENEFMDIRAGYGLLSHRWGQSNVNKWGLSGFNFDLTFTDRDAGIPWLGIKALFYNQSEWIWFDTPYVSFFARQKIYLNGGN